MSVADSEAIRLQFEPSAAGMLLAPDEFDSAEFEDGYRYELIRGVLVVSPAPSPQECGLNVRLGHWLCF